MLKTLFKYDFGYMKRIWKVLLPVMPIVSLIAAIAFRIMFSLSYNEDSLVVAIVVVPITSIVGSIGTMCLFASYIVNIVFIGKRFSSNLYSDEAYLTFMLPVKREKLLLSKFLNATLWNCLMMVMFIICFFIYLIVVPPTSDGALVTFEYVQKIFSAFGTAFKEKPVLMTAISILVPIITVESLVAEVLLLHYYISAVRSFAGFPIWIATNSVLGVIGSIMASFGAVGLYEINPPNGNAIIIILLFCTSVMYAAIGLLLYLKTQDNMKFKLNVG